jgi:hypothetical protein
MEFWRRREPALGRRRNVAGEDRGCGGMGLVAAVAAGHAVATNTTGSASAPASPLGRLISRTRSARQQRPALGRSQRSDPDPSTNAIRIFRKSWRLTVRRCRRKPVSAGCAVPMSNMPLQRTKAVSSRSMVNEPGPRGSSDDPNAAARPRQCYYRPSPTAFAAERQGVRRTWHLVWSSELERWQLACEGVTGQPDLGVALRAGRNIA